MTRLDSMIRRLTTQRACLDWAIAEIEGVGGVALEFGLGNGRSYDHLRAHLPGREIFVFDRKVAAHPDCIPPDDRMIVGEFSDTAPEAARRFAARAALIHGDVGSGDAEASRALTRALAPHWRAMLAPGGLILSDHPVEGDDLSQLPLPQGSPGRYFIARKAG